MDFPDAQAQAVEEFQDYAVSCTDEFAVGEGERGKFRLCGQYQAAYLGAVQGAGNGLRNLKFFRVKIKEPLMGDSFLVQIPEKLAEGYIFSLNGVGL